MFGRIALYAGISTTLGMAGYSAIPWIFNAFVDNLGLTTGQASWLTTAELAIMGATMMALAPWMHRVSHRRLLGVGFAAGVGAQLLTPFAHGLLPLTLARCVTGFGYGAIYAAASSAGALSDEPERTYARAGAITLILGTALNPMLGVLTGRYGFAGATGGAVLFSAALGLGLLFVLPPSGPVAYRRVDAAHGPLNWGAAIGTMLVMSIFTVGTSGVYILMTRIGTAAGVANEELGFGLAVVSLVSSLGGVAADRLGMRAGRTVPAVGGLLAMGGLSFWLTALTTPAAYWVAITGYVGVTWFVYPYLFGLAVAADGQGRVAAATGSTLILVGAVGAAVSGALQDSLDMMSVGVFALGCCVMAAALCVVVVRRLGAPAPAAPALLLADGRAP